MDGLDDLAKVHGGRAVDAFVDSLAESTRRGLREVDVVFRPTRGEIWAILPETEPSGARAVAERVRTLAGKVLFKPQDAASRRALPLKATTSVGLATCPSEGISSASDLVARASAALDEARRGGGDRVEPGPGMKADSPRDPARG